MPPEILSSKAPLATLKFLTDSSLEKKSLKNAAYGEISCNRLCLFKFIIAASSTVKVIFPTFFIPLALTPKNF